MRSQGFGAVGTGFAELADFISLPTPEYAVHKGGSERATAECFELTDACAQRMLEQRMLDGAVCHTRIQGVLERLRQRGFAIANVGASEQAISFNSAFQIPVGLCFLIRSAGWRTVALAPNGRWDPDCDASQLLQEVRRAAAGCELNGQKLQTFLKPTEMQPAHQFYNMLADDLCEWGRAIVEAADEPDVTAAGLEQYIIWLNSMREATSAKRVMVHVWEATGKGLQGGRFNKAAESHGRYRAMFLIQCILLALHLKSSSTMARALRRAFAVLPGVWSQTLSHCFSVERVPSGATISRARLYLDAAFMLHMRERHEQLLESQTVFYALMDSSPSRLPELAND